MWIIIAQIICLAATIGLLSIVYELDKETPGLIRYLMVGFAIAFFIVFLVAFNKRIGYELAAAIALVGMGVMVLSVVAYLILTKKIQPIVLKVSGTALGVIVLVWLVGSCSDSRRQKDQIIDANKAPTSQTVAIGDSTKRAISIFDSLSNQ
jgi:inner membrane protein involved in colicin E2 resistance